MSLTRQPRAEQALMPFLVRSGQRRRWFKGLITLGTLLTLVGMVAAVPRARYLAAAAVHRSRELALQAFGIPRGRAEIEAEWGRYRRQEIADTRRRFDEVYADIDPPLRRLMAYAGNDPQTGLLRWGNYHQTLLLPSAIFEPDDHGRSYRLRPSTRSIWLRNLTIQRIPLTFFLVPDGPGLAEAATGTTAVRVEGSTQTTNSWGLRGPEPDRSAPIRGIVLGDSFMQGLFVGDDDTPSERLRHRLEKEFKTGVSILNTGHLGYSTEQEYYTLEEYGERFDPRFVVLSIFANDFGDIHAVSAGKADWDEARYWLGEILRYCQEHGILLLTVTTPMESQITGRRVAGDYPGRITEIMDVPGTYFLDPTEEFVREHLRLVIAGERAGRRPTTSPLFNGIIGDGHFSAIGSELWAHAVGRRLILLDRQRRGRPS